jgi:hypothetical protein
MAIEFKTEITNGNGHRFNSLSDALASGINEIVDSRLKAAERAAQGQVCPVHQQRPSVKRHRVGSRYELRVEACCDDAAASAKAAASRVFND